VLNVHCSIVQVQICTTSTVAVALIINMLVAEVVERFCAMWLEPAVFRSANVDGGDEFDRKWEKALVSR